MLLGWHSAAMHCGSVQLSLVNWIIQEGDCNTLMGKTGEYSIFAVCCLEEGLHIVMPVGSENLVTGQCGLGVEARGVLPGGMSGALLALGGDCTWDKGLVFRANSELL